jgi:hypothetical protein
MAYMYELHNFEQDPQSGAGNCKECNDAKETHKHPHEFRKARDHMFCVCGSPKRALLHQVARI